MCAKVRAREAALLKERWALMESGISCLSIKIRSKTLYANGRLHGEVLENIFHEATLPDPITSPVENIHASNAADSENPVPSGPQSATTTIQNQ